MILNDFMKQRMEVISGRPAIDYLCFLQMIIDKLSSKEDPTKGDLQTINDAKQQINLILNTCNNE